MRTGLLDLLTQSPERLTILVVDGSEHLAYLRTLYPNAEIHAITPYEDIAEHYSLMRLGIHWHVLDWRCDPLPFDEEIFDRIIAEFVIESAYEPYDMLMALNRRLKETGTLYTSFTNVRHHTILEALRMGHFPVCSEQHLYAKPEIVRLLNDSLYKEIHFIPGEQDEDSTAALAWEREGFENFSADLSTRVWLIRAERSTAAAANLKYFFTREIRHRIALLLHRIEYGISPEETIAELHTLCIKEGIFRTYLEDFITQICIHSENVRLDLYKILEEI